MSCESMEAVILCGGLGTRLREETEFRPKPMVEIGGKPMLWHIMNIYARAGVRRFILCLGYKGDAIRHYFLNYRYTTADFTVRLDSGDVFVESGADPRNWEVVLAETGDDTMTGSRIARVLPHVRGPRFFATYGDGVADIDIAALYRHHLANALAATLTAVSPPSRYGEVQMTEGGHVRYFVEKPQMSGSGYINGGFFVFEKAAFARYAPRNPEVETQCFLEADILTRLAEDGQITAFRHDGFWQCMDTYRETQLLNKLWESGHAPWVAGRVKEEAAAS